ELLKLALTHSVTGERFKSLYVDGDLAAYGGDESSADLALMGMIAYWTGKDGKRMWKWFRQSKLMRDNAGQVE
ncbi:MAG TPA: hypothetical protein VJ508_12685, partial [Saprospiraceae bacterium]|nr:hypothetical protein [Saprospiraceae bacterium]